MVHSQYWTGKKDRLKALVKKTDRNHLFFYLVYKECKLDGKPIGEITTKITIRIILFMRDVILLGGSNLAC